MDEIISKYKAKREKLYIRFIIAGSIAIIAYLLSYFIAANFPLKGFYDNLPQQSIQLIIALFYIGASSVVIATIFKINDVNKTIRYFEGR